MIVALDYDGTFTADPELWTGLAITADSRGHRVVMVTMRYPHEAIEDAPVEVIYTSRKAKKPYLEAMGIKVDVWIDDNPGWIYTDAGWNA